MLIRVLRNAAMTFSEKFCAKHNVRPEDFEATVLRMSLKPSARLFQPILNLIHITLPQIVSLSAVLVASRGLRTLVQKLMNSLNIPMEAVSFIAV